MKEKVLSVLAYMITFTICSFALVGMFVNIPADAPTVIVVTSLASTLTIIINYFIKKKEWLHG